MKCTMLWGLKYIIISQTSCQAVLNYTVYHISNYYLWDIQYTSQYLCDDIKCFTLIYDLHDKWEYLLTLLNDVK